jgi:uncharacterized membrane protein (DUF2068 family)
VRVWRRNGVAIAREAKGGVMAAQRILAIGRMQAVMDRVLDELRAAGFEAQGALDDDAVVQMAADRPYDVLVVGGGVSEEGRANVIARVRALRPAIALAEPQGPGQVLESVRAALEGR